MKHTVCVEARPFAAFSSAQMDRLKARPDLEVTDCRGKTVDDPAFMAQLEKTEIVISGNDLHITADLLARMPHLKLIAKLGVGLDMIDIPAATAHGVQVCNTPGANDVAVAEHTFALLLAHLRQVVRCDQGLRRGLWEETAIMGTELSEKTLGVIGLGAIGRCVATRGIGFNMKVIGYDPYWPETFASEHGIERVELHDLLKRADIVSIHCPLMDSTRHCIDTAELAMMKPEAVLVNMARGGVVNEQALYDALKRHVIRGAILDAFEEEPPKHLLFADLDNVTLSPHVGAFTTDAMEKMAKGVVDQTFEFLDGKNPKHLKNPETAK